jgi:hypothetical protein
MLPDAALYESPMATYRSGPVAAPDGDARARTLADVRTAMKAAARRNVASLQVDRLVGGLPTLVASGNEQTAIGLRSGVL